ncbi:MAG: hypothetical protein K6E98_10350 [Lachnospiraceae bacterium]|nr:hypothetical protein [Lachnospiraceae bacterium]
MGHHYCVIYTQTAKQQQVRDVLREALPEAKGYIFYPCMEVYRRDKGGIVDVQALFPGYVFIRSDMELPELHEFIRNHTRNIGTFVRELSFYEQKCAGEVDELNVSDLNEDEAKFMDFLLDSDECSGLLKMSYGYREGKKKFKVVEGPLKVYEDHIADVRAHDRRAYLDLKINGRTVCAGFTVMPKKHYFPEDDKAPEVLSDGSELDIKELLSSMTKLS